MKLKQKITTLLLLSTINLISCSGSESQNTESTNNDNNNNSTTTINEDTDILENYPLKSSGEYLKLEIENYFKIDEEYKTSTCFAQFYIMKDSLKISQVDLLPPFKNKGIVRILQGFNEDFINSLPYSNTTYLIDISCDSGKYNKIKAFKYQKN